MKKIISVSPHIKTRRTTRTIMLDVLISLLPATAAGFVYFGGPAVVLVLLSLASCFLSEFIYFLVREKFYRAPKEVFARFFKQFDLTSLVTGLLLALCLPASYEGWYLPVLGGIFSVCAVKMLFGGTGKNIVNPALAGRVFLLVSFSVLMNAYPDPAFGTIATNASDLASVKTGATQLQSILAGNGAVSPLDLFLGTGVAGCIGETCKLALLLGGVYLVVRGVVRWYLPVLYLLSASLFGTALEGQFGFNLILGFLLSGGLMLGAIFMATDYVTTPKTRIGNIVYFILLGLLTAGLRKAAGFEVVSFCILLMNFLVFLIDLVFRARPFGSARRRRKKEAQ